MFSTDHIKDYKQYLIALYILVFSFSFRVIGSLGFAALIAGGWFGMMIV